MKKGTILYGAACFILGAAICGGSAAYATEKSAARSLHTVYVDGERVELEAYLIDGYNYVKLRDVGKAVGFNVYWDGTVQIQSDEPYTGAAPEDAAPEVTVPAVATETQVLAALRETVASGKASAPMAMTAQTRKDMGELLALLGEWPVYQVKTEGDGSSRFTVSFPTGYTAAAERCRPFIASLSGMSGRERVREIAFYVCDRLTYRAGASSSIEDIFRSDGIHAGNCMTYAHSFAFLCGLADIPCVYVRSATHQWNEVYVDGQWWSVDVTSNDVGDDPSVRPYQAVLTDPGELYGGTYKLAQPELVEKAKSILVP